MVSSSQFDRKRGVKNNQNRYIDIVRPAERPPPLLESQTIKITLYNMYMYHLDQWETEFLCIGLAANRFFKRPNCSLILILRSESVNVVISGVKKLFF